MQRSKNIVGVKKKNLTLIISLSLIFLALSLFRKTNHQVNVLNCSLHATAIAIATVQSVFDSYINLIVTVPTICEILNETISIYLKKSLFFLQGLKWLLHHIMVPFSFYYYLCFYGSAQMYWVEISTPFLIIFLEKKGLI